MIKIKSNTLIEKKWLENNYRLVTSQLSNSHVNNQKNQLKCNIL